MANKYGWIKDTKKAYFAYSEGNYYKVNKALVYRILKRELVLRNTYTGEEEVLAKRISLNSAKIKMNKYMQENPVN